MDFSETIAASDLKVGRCRHLIEIMKVPYVSIEGQGHFLTIYFPGFVCTRPRYQVSVYRTIGPLVYLVNKAQHITESQGSQYSHQPAQPSFMGKQILSYRQNKNNNNEFDG